MGLSLRTTAYVVVACAASPRRAWLSAGCRADAGAGVAVGRRPSWPPARPPSRGSTASSLRRGGASRAGLVAARARQGAHAGRRGRVHGRPGDADDVVAAALVRRTTSADVRVPIGAVAGPVAVVDRSGALTAPSVAPLAVEPDAADGARRVRPARAARASTTRRSRPRSATSSTAPLRCRVTVELVRADDGVVDRALGPRRGRAGGAAAGHLGRARRRQGAATGRYEFRVAARRRGAGRRSAVRLRPRPLPDPRQVQVRHRRRRRSAAGAGTRATTSSPRAGRRWWPRTAASSSTPATTAAPGTTS